MSLTAYVVPITWVPDDEIVNNANGTIEYLAWQIGRSINLEQAMWLLAPVRDPATDIEDVLPVGYSTQVLLDDVTRYGFDRALRSRESINALEDAWDAEVASTITAVDEGYL